jgi:hypothetical protein
LHQCTVPVSWSMWHVNHSVLHAWREVLVQHTVVTAAQAAVVGETAQAWMSVVLWELWIFCTVGCWLGMPQACTYWHASHQRSGDAFGHVILSLLCIRVVNRMTGCKCYWTRNSVRCCRARALRAYIAGLRWDSCCINACAEYATQLSPCLGVLLCLSAGLAGVACGPYGSAVAAGRLLSGRML